jgi:hypothetical protein
LPAVPMHHAPAQSHEAGLGGLGKLHASSLPSGPHGTTSTYLYVRAQATRDYSCRVTDFPRTSRTMQCPSTLPGDGRWTACRTSVPGRHTTSPGTGGTGKRRILVSLLVFGQDHIRFTSIFKPPRPGLESTRLASHLPRPWPTAAGVLALLACRRGFLWLRRPGRTTRLVDARRTAEGPATLTADTPHTPDLAALALLCSALLLSVAAVSAGWGPTLRSRLESHPAPWHSSHGTTAQAFGCLFKLATDGQASGVRSANPQREVPYRLT